MKAKLISRWGVESGAEFAIGAEAAIGRAGDNDVQLDAKSVSSQHARIFFDPEARAYFLEDLGSLNGTRIDGTPVTRIERLGRMHVIDFGGACELLFVTVDTAAAPAAAAEPATGGTRVEAEAPVLPAALADGESAGGGTRIEAVPVVLPPALAGNDAGADAAAAAGAEPEAEESAAQPGFVLAVIEEGAPRRFSLGTGENLVGRSKGAEVALASPQLSRRHALIVVAGERVTVRDLGSRNHTFVEDRQIEEGAEVEIETRSRLRFGLVEAYLVRRDDDDLTIPVVPEDEA